MSAFRTNRRFKRWALMAMGLALLPADNILPAWESLRSESVASLASHEKRQFADLKRYIGSYWMETVGPHILSVAFAPRRRVVRATNSCKYQNGSSSGRNQQSANYSGFPTCQGSIRCEKSSSSGRSQQSAAACGFSCRNTIPCTQAAGRSPIRAEQAGGSPLRSERT